MTEAPLAGSCQPDVCSCGRRAPTSPSVNPKDLAARFRLLSVHTGRSSQETSPMWPMFAYAACNSMPCPKRVKCRLMPRNASWPFDRFWHILPIAGSPILPVGKKGLQVLRASCSALYCECFLLILYRDWYGVDRIQTLQLGILEQYRVAALQHRCSMFETGTSPKPVTSLAWFAAEVEKR